MTVAEKIIIKKLKERAMSMANYLVADEAEDFVENLEDYHWKIEGDEEIENALDEIRRSIEEGTVDATLEIINKYIVEPEHIYIEILKFYQLSTMTRED